MANAIVTHAKSIRILQAVYTALRSLCRGVVLQTEAFRTIINLFSLPSSLSYPLHVQGKGLPPYPPTPLGGAA